MATISMDVGSLGVTAGYLATAALVAHRQSPLARGCGAFLVLLAVERQLSLGSRLGGEVRSLARGAGWYGGRVAIQIAATVVVIVLALAASSVLLQRAGRDRMVVIGVVALAALGAVRMLSLHAIDRVLSDQTFGFRIRVAIEVAMLGFLAMAAISDTSRPADVLNSDRA